MTEIMRINNVAADTVRTPQNLQYAVPNATELQNVYQSQIWPNRYYNMLAQAMTRNPVTLNAVDATGKIGGVRFYVSGSYQNQEGAITGLNGTNQRRGRVNLDYDARQDLTISVSSLYDNGYVDNRSGGSSNGSIFGQLLRGAAIGTDYLARDTLGRPLVRAGGANLRSATGNGGGTFLYDTEYLQNYNKSTRYLGNMTARYFPAEWITLEGTFAYDNRQRANTNYQLKGYRTFTTSSSQNNGNIGFGNVGDESLNGNVTASLRKQLRSDLNGRLQLRALFDQENVASNSSSGQIFSVKDIFTTSNTQTRCGRSRRPGSCRC